MKKPTQDEVLRDPNVAAEYLGENAMWLIKQILIKHDRAILEESHRLIREAYERGFVDGMQKQMQSSVDRAVNVMADAAKGRT
jgi:hypothetical protein